MQHDRPDATVALDGPPWQVGEMRMKMVVEDDVLRTVAEALCTAGHGDQ